MFVILDLDQTVADNKHREHFLEKTPKDWDSFFAPERVYRDEVIAGAAEAITKFRELKYEIVILTARREDLRDATMRWLLEKLDLAIPDERLLMRPLGNMLGAADFKHAQLLEFKQGLEDPGSGFLIIEDNLSCCASLATFGTVLKAPECWSILFPATIEPKELP